MTKAILKQAVLTGASLNDVDLYKADLAEANLKWADLIGAYLCSANCNKSILIGSILTNVIVIQKRILTGTQYHSKQFTDTHSDITYDATKFPVGFDISDAGMTDVSLP